jgi:hypothetical protein
MSCEIEGWLKIVTAAKRVFPKFIRPEKVIEKQLQQCREKK